MVCTCVCVEWRMYCVHNRVSSCGLCLCDGVFVRTKAGATFILYVYIYILYIIYRYVYTCFTNSPLYYSSREATYTYDNKIPNLFSSKTNPVSVNDTKAFPSSIFFYDMITNKQYSALPHAND